MMQIDVYIISLAVSNKNRVEHFVRISCEDRSTETRMYPDDFYNRALYERDTLRHVLLGWPEPDILDDKYADKTETVAQVMEKD